MDPIVEMGIKDDQPRATGSAGRGGNLDGATVTLVPPDDEPNPNNPYDRLPPEERERKIVELCARIRRRRGGDDAGQDRPIGGRSRDG